MRTAAWICTVFSLLLCKLGDGKKNCILMLKSSHPGGAKTFSELKDSRNSLKQVKTFEASQNVSAALQEARLLGLKVFFADEVPHNET